MKIYAYMESGIQKSASEDTMLVNGQLLKDGYFIFDKSGNCIAIADGVGGNAGGREASEFVVNQLKDGIVDNILPTVQKINSELIDYSKTICGKEEMATTLSAILFNNNSPTQIVHVGNTRISAIQGEYLKPLTHDHTTVELLKLRGEYEAADNAPKNEITACLGAGTASMLKQLQVIELGKEYAGLIITSDGIHDYLDDEIIENFVTMKKFDKLSFESLIGQARENGSSDDASIIIAILKG